MDNYNETLNEFYKADIDSDIVDDGDDSSLPDSIPIMNMLFKRMTIQR